jgi:AcrR family transcriptional regulator
MAKRIAAKTAPPARKRRTADEARSSILDAAEKRLVLSGPAGIRLQEVAADVGVSHPTVLHHFGSREGLVEAVVARALDSLSSGLLGAVRAAPEGGTQEVEVLLDAVFQTLVTGGHARAFLWLALSGYAPPIEELRIRAVAEAVHEVRVERRKKLKKSRPVFEDTYFTVMLPALALLAMSVVEPGDGANAGGPGSPTRFRAWLAGLIHGHLER